MSDLLLLPCDGELAFQFDFTDMVVAPTTLVSVTYTVPSPLTAFGQTDDLANFKSTIGLKGAVHGQTYVVQALGTLSNGEKVPKDAVFVGFNG